MKFRNIVYGLFIGTIGGLAIALLNRRTSVAKEGNLEDRTHAPNVMDDIKSEVGNVKTRVMSTTKNTPETFKSLTAEVKDLISNFQADISPNIDNIKENVDNLSNRGESIQKHMEENPIKFIGKK